MFIRSRSLRLAMLVAGACAASLLAAGGAAQAAPPAAGSPAITVTSAATAGTSTCFTGSLCLYEGEGFTGEVFRVSSLVPNGTCVSLVDHGWGDRAHSALNANSDNAAMFMNDDCVGGPYLIPANSGLPSFGGFTPESVWVR